MPSGPAVIVMARAPRPGEGKTRLRSVLPDDACLRLQEAFVRDALDVSISSGIGPVHLAFTPVESTAWVNREFGANIVSFVQEGETLGDRMLGALRHVEAAGYAPLLMIGTDSPLLTPRHLRDAVRALQRSDLCLGPSDDGGYYLIGCHEPIETLLDDVAWGTDAVLKTTLLRGKEAGLRCELLDELYDVDTPEDLDRLVADLLRLDSAAPERTAQALRALEGV